MKVFIGGSSERKDLLSEVATWIGPKAGEPALRWDAEEAFPLGGSTWTSLLNVANRVHAAAFIMTPDDLTWHRDSLLTKARDNVILEYGLFTGILGSSRVIMCVDSDTSLASDVKGITYANLRDKDSARRGIELWIDGLKKSHHLSSLEIDRIYIHLLKLVKDSGFIDADIEYWSATYAHDDQRKNIALKAGADEYSSPRIALNRYNAKMIYNKEYLELLTTLRMST